MRRLTAAAISGEAVHQFQLSNGAFSFIPWNLTGGKVHHRSCKAA